MDRLFRTARYKCILLIFWAGVTNLWNILTTKSTYSNQTPFARTLTCAHYLRLTEIQNNSTISYIIDGGIEYVKCHTKPTYRHGDSFGLNFQMNIGSSGWFVLRIISVTKYFTIPKCLQHITRSIRSNYWANFLIL